MWLLSSAAMAADPDQSQADVSRQAQETQIQLRALTERVAKIESLLQNQATLNLLKEVETLKSELSRLRGQAELQAHQVETLGKRQSDLYVDLDKRVEDMNKQFKVAAASPAPQTQVATPADTAVVAKTAPAQASATNVAATGKATDQTKADQAKPDASRPDSAKTAPAKPADTPEDPLAESKSYETALNLFKTGNYAGAISEFKHFLKAYPDSTLASNAQYWTGYAYYALKDYKNALEQQKKLVSTWPQSTKVPDALLNMASNQVELGDLASAKKNLEEIAAKYPGTNAAAIASKRLALLK